MQNVVRLDRSFEDPFPAEVVGLDAVLLVLFYHDAVWLKVDREKMNRAVYRALAPGGVYGIVDHSAKAGRASPMRRRCTGSTSRSCDARSSRRASGWRGGRLPAQSGGPEELECLAARGGGAARHERSLRAEVRQAGGGRRRDRVTRCACATDARSARSSPARSARHSPGARRVHGARAARSQRAPAAASGDRRPRSCGAPGVAPSRSTISSHAVARACGSGSEACERERGLVRQQAHLCDACGVPAPRPRARGRRGRRRRGCFDLRPVAARMRARRIGQRVGQRAVVGEQQQSLAVVVETPAA